MINNVQLDTNTVFFETHFQSLDFAEKIMSNKEFEKCIFEKSSFVKCTFDTCKFIDCTFIECVLSAIQPINSVFSDLKFKESRVIGFDWTKARSIHSLDFNNCQINYSNFSFVKLPHLNLINCEAKEVDFSEANITESNFEGTNFENSRFQKTNLTKCNFKKALNYSIDFKNNTLTKAVFSLPEAMSLLNSLDIILD